MGKRKGSNGKLRGKTFISAMELATLKANQIDNMSIEEIRDYLKIRLQNELDRLEY